MKSTVFLLPLILALSACGSDAPKVADRYADGLKMAWEQANRGEAPTNQCARVIGTAVGLARTSADQIPDAKVAYKACYLEVQTQWVRKRIELAEAEGDVCLSLMTGLSTSRLSLGSFADDLGLVMEDLNTQLVQNVSVEVERACPGQADLILAGKVT